MGTGIILKMKERIATRKHLEERLTKNKATLEQKAKAILSSLEKEYYWIERCREKGLMNDLSKTVMEYYIDIEDLSLKTSYGCLLLKIFFDLGILEEIENVVCEIQSLAEKTEDQEFFLRIGNSYGVLLIEEDTQSAETIFLNLSEMAKSIERAIPETFELIGDIFKNLAITLSKEDPSQAIIELDMAKAYYEVAGVSEQHKKQLAKMSKKFK